MQHLVVPVAAAALLSSESCSAMLPKAVPDKHPAQIIMAKFEVFLESTSMLTKGFQAIARRVKASLLAAPGILNGENDEERGIGIVLFVS